MAIPTGAGPAKGVPAPPYPRRTDAVVYDWDLTTDAFSWGDNVADALRGFPPETLASGAALAACEARDGGPSRQSSLLAAALSTDGGAPCHVTSALQGPDGDRLEVADSGRWLSGVWGRRTRMHGLLRVVRRRPGPIVEPPPRGPRAVEALSGAEVIDAMIARARARHAAGAAFAIALVSIEGDAAGLANRAEDFGRRVARSLRADESFGRLAPSRFIALLGTASSSLEQVRLRPFAEALNAAAPGDEEGRRPGTLRVGFALSGGGARIEEVFWNAGQALTQARDAGTVWACRSGERDEARSNRVEPLAAAVGEAPAPLVFRPLTPLAPYAAPIHRALPGQAPFEGARRAVDQAVAERALAKLIARPEVRIAVNLSPETLGDAGFIAFLTAALRGWPELARRLIIETASAVPREPLALLRAAGARVALTGFGARGWPSGQPLPPADILMIDGALIQNLSRSSEDRSHVRALIACAQGLGASVAAEWVDDAEAFRLLGQWGCDYAEGAAAGAPLDDIPRRDDRREAAA